MRKTLATMLLGFSTTLLLGGCAGGNGETDAGGGVSSSGSGTPTADAGAGEEIAAESSTRVTDDPIEAAYFGVYVWKAAVEKAQSFEIDKVREAVYGLEFDAPGGKKSMHESNQHTLKPVYIGEILKDGQFKIVKAFNDGKLVVPDSYSSYLHPDGDVPSPTGGPKT